MQRMLDEQKYVVIGSSRPCTRGEVLYELEGPDHEPLGVTTVVLDTATREDMAAQIARYRYEEIPQYGRGWPYYYKVIAE